MVGTPPAETREVKAAAEGRIEQSRMPEICSKTSAPQLCTKIQVTHDANEDDGVAGLSVRVDLADPL